MNAYYVYVYQETRWFKYLVLAECQRNAIYEVKTRYFLTATYKDIKAFPVDTDVIHCYLLISEEYGA